MKQIIQGKDPNWPEANKLAISKPGLGFKLDIALPRTNTACSQDGT